MTSLAEHWATVRQLIREEKALGASITRVDDTDFLPAALEIIERPVSPTARYTAMALMGGLVIAIMWLILGRLDIVVSAPGRLVPADAVKVIQAADSGTVRAILVRESQAVKKGQVLLELDPTVSTAEAAQARKALETAELDVARGRAVLGALNGEGFHFLAPPGTSQAVLDVQTALARAELESIRGGSSMRSADRQAAASAYSAAMLEAAKISETLPLVDQQIEANEKLLAKGYVSKLRVIEMNRQRLAMVKDREIAQETARRARAQMASAGGSMEQTVGATRAKLLQDLAQAEADARIRREEMVKATRRSTLQRLVSPVDGTVAQLSLHTIGGVVDMGKPLMLIVPINGQLVAEVKMLNRDVGFVRLGQTVAVKIAAFPFMRFGAVPGRVESIGSDAVEDEKLGLVYTVRISIDRDRRIQEGTSIPLLVPGMEVTADIRTGERSIASYLVSPLQTTVAEAGRER
ncbi:MAG TPA: HlyD family type I secretion periplasmic adaptor subunit [Sphingobium sp.]|nr:HlyD family type I secretion periplasmic adaptor subunit [Sphingobium sp.]